MGAPEDVVCCITVFEKIANSTFKRFQPSKMCTTKWNMLEHFVQDIKQLGGFCT